MEQLVKNFMAKNISVKTLIQILAHVAKVIIEKSEIKTKQDIELVADKLEAIFGTIFFTTVELESDVPELINALFVFVLQEASNIHKFEKHLNSLLTNKNYSVN